MAHSNKIHEGRNVKRFREMLGIKQDTLAFELGDDWTQKKISLLEQKETIEPDILSLVSGVLKIPVEAFQNFDEEQAIYNISCNFSDNAINYNRVDVQHINSVDKIHELYEEKMALYERMLKDKDDQLKMIKEMIENK